TAYSALAVVTINVAAINNPPVAKGRSVVTTPNVSLPIQLTGEDAEGASLIYAIVIGPTHGTLTGTGSNLTYTPVANYVGPDSFTFLVGDGELISAPATVNVSVLSG